MCFPDKWAGGQLLPRTLCLREVSAGILNPVLKLISAVAGPKYDVEYLRSKIRELLGDTKLSETLTNVVIPAFDIKFLHPTIFSSFKMKSEPLKDAMLSDICIGTSAAPTYFPAHYFATEDAAGGRREFNLVDGCVAANNPTLALMSQVMKAISLRKADFFPICRPTDYGKFLVISLGAGSNKQEKRYSAKESGRWGVLAWLYDKDTMVTPIDGIEKSLLSSIVLVKQDGILSEKQANLSKRISEDDRRCAVPHLAETTDETSPRSAEILRMNVPCSSSITHIKTMKPF
ncbi:patatin-like protein 2 [Curcuma longa]|uniref:patatin-like protein 2 n=1 Tax=Curcuma longa TaxID=136217 RepID=UPI003D9FA010